jgi:hypothetical protein
MIGMKAIGQIIFDLTNSLVSFLGEHCPEHPAVSGRHLVHLVKAFGKGAAYSTVLKKTHTGPGMIPFPKVPEILENLVQRGDVVIICDFRRFDVFVFVFIGNYYTLIYIGYFGHAASGAVGYKSKIP